jgi:hypothetical protein
VRKIQLIILVLNKDKMSETLPTGFSNCKRLEDGIYECEPTGVLNSEDNYPYWIIASLDLITDLTDNDLENVRYFKPIIGKDGHYIATANGKSIIAIPQIEFRRYFGDEYDDFGIVVPRTIPTSKKDREDVARSVNIDHLKTPGVRKGRNTALTPISNRQRTQRVPSPGQSVNLFSSSYKDSPVREKLKEIVDDIPPTIPSTISRLKKNKKSLKKSLKSLKKNKKSLKKSKKKSKSSIKCKKTPYAWKSSSIKKSPFRKLERAKNAETKYKAGQSIGFTAISSLKSLGRIPRSDGCYVLGAKYSELKRQ